MRVRPRRSLIRSGIFATLAAGVPLFVVLYWLSLSQGNWHGVLAVQVLYMAFFALFFVRHFAAYVEVTETTVTKQALVLRSVVDRSDVAALHFADTYNTSSSEVIPQLWAVDASGARIFRLRGTFWGRDDMLTVAHAIGAPLTVKPEPLAIREFYTQFPGVAYWYEGKAWLAVLGIIVAFGLAYLALNALMMAIGIPSVMSMQ